MLILHPMTPFRQGPARGRTGCPPSGRLQHLRSRYAERAARGASEHWPLYAPIASSTRSRQVGVSTLRFVGRLILRIRRGDLVASGGCFVIDSPSFWRPAPRVRLKQQLHSG